MERNFMKHLKQRQNTWRKSTVSKKASKLFVQLVIQLTQQFRKRIKGWLKPLQPAVKQYLTLNIT